MQPDFSRLFPSDKVLLCQFRVRSWPCYIHDVQFLSGYLHDAGISLDAVTKRGKKVVIFTPHLRPSEAEFATQWPVAAKLGIRTHQNPMSIPKKGSRRV